MEINKIYNMDCLEGMKKIDDGTVDLIVTDPPYNVSVDNNFKTMGRAGIDFGEWDKGFDLTSWIEQAVNKLKKGGNIVIFTDWKKTSYVVEALSVAGCDVKDMIRLIKSNPMPRNRDRRFITDYEIAVWAVKKGKWTFNRLSETYERPEINTTVTPKSEKSITNHPTQKPLYAMEWLIKRLSNEGDLILDGFIGSGTTAIACLNTNRNYIGFELDEGYYKEAIKRINNHEVLKWK